MQKLLKKSRLFLLAAVLAGSAIVSTPPRVEAKVCPYGTYPSTATTYYTDASHSTVVCSDNDCSGIYCDTPTPYYRTFTFCCPAN